MRTPPSNSRLLPLLRGDVQQRGRHLVRIFHLLAAVAAGFDRLG
jgi:hypothetical protein